MSFTTTIKEEISRIDNTRSESISELSGFLRNNGSCTDTTIDLLTELTSSVVENRAVSYAVGDTICGAERFKSYVERAKEDLKHE